MDLHRTLQNLYITKGTLAEFQEKNPEKRARSIALYDQLKAIALSAKDTEMAALVISAVGCECVLETVKQYLNKTEEKEES